MSKTVIVFGALSVQGLSVVNSLLRFGRDQFVVRAAVRGTSEDPDSQTLLQMGAQLFSANLEDIHSMTSVVQGAWAVFVDLPVPLTEKDCIGKMVVCGKNIIAACQKAQVEHVIYSTAPSPLKMLGISARHFDARAKVEHLFRQSRLNVIYLMVPLTYESLFDMLKPKNIEKGHYALGIPTGPALIDYMSAEDLGLIIVNLLSNPTSFVGRTVAVSAGKLSTKDMCATLNKICAPVVFHNNMTTYDGFRCKQDPGSLDWGNMFEFLVRIDQQYDRERTLSLNPHLISFEDWLRNHREFFLTLLDA